MYIKTLPLGYVSANCHIIKDELSGEGAIVDPGDCNLILEQEIAKADIKSLKYILLTHGHFDHISGVAKLKEKYPETKVVIGCEDAPLLKDSTMSLASVFGLPFTTCYEDIKVKDNDSLYLGAIEIKVIATPGHSLGGVVYHIPSERIAFTGDTLFKCSIGRTDLYGGDDAVLSASLKKLQKVLTEETVIYTGHGNSTKMNYEKMYNPYLR